MVASFRTTVAEIEQAARLAQLATPSLAVSFAVCDQTPPESVKT